MSPPGSSRYLHVNEQTFALAERLIEKHAFEKPLRTLDAVQLAIALGLTNQDLIDHFVAADAAICEVAALEGVPVPAFVGAEAHRFPNDA